MKVLKGYSIVLVILAFFVFAPKDFWNVRTIFTKEIFPIVILVVLIVILAISNTIMKIKKNRGNKKPKTKKVSSKDLIKFDTAGGKLHANPFRGILVVGSNGSGKSDSVAVPLIKQFIEQDFSGIIYDFKFSELAREAETFLRAKKSDLRHFFLDLNNSQRSHKINVLNPAYLPNTSYAREYSTAIVSNLMKESVTNPDFWSRSATDLLTACIWYLREERPDICDLPHVLAMVTSSSTPLLELLQTNDQTAQMTVSMYDALLRKSDSQLSGVLGTLQSAVAQINTPELMYIFSGSDFDLNLNNPDKPVILTVGNFPTLKDTFAPLCSLVITVATKLMNQPGKQKSFVMVDELHTLYLPNIDILPNTGRSNNVATVFMLQDIAQLADRYGKNKADVLFASCNTHIYGRVASGTTAEILSRQFGKTDKLYNLKSEGTSNLINFSSGQNESIQERDIIKPAEFLNFTAGEMAGIAVGDNVQTFKTYFNLVKRDTIQELPAPKHLNYDTPQDVYKQVREDVKRLLS